MIRRSLQRGDAHHRRVAEHQERPDGVLPTSTDARSEVIYNGVEEAFRQRLEPEEVRRRLPRSGFDRPTCSSWAIPSRTRTSTTWCGVRAGPRAARIRRTAGLRRRPRQAASSRSASAPISSASATSVRLLGHVAQEATARHLPGRRRSSSTPRSTRASGCRSSRRWRRGVPVITSNTSALQGDRRPATLHLVDPLDVDGMAHAIARCMVNPERRAELAERGTPAGRGLPLVARRRERTRDVYLAAIGSKRPIGDAGQDRHAPPPRLERGHRPAVSAPPQARRVALVHDWLTGMRGGEKVLERSWRALPRRPPIYTLFHFPGTSSPAIESPPDPHQLPAAAPPALRGHYRRYLPLFPRAIEALRPRRASTSSISSSHCVAKGAITAGRRAPSLLLPHPDALRLGPAGRLLPAARRSCRTLRNAVLARLRPGTSPPRAALADPRQLALRGRSHPTLLRPRSRGRPSAGRHRLLHPRRGARTVARPTPCWSAALGAVQANRPRDAPPAPLPGWSCAWSATARARRLARLAESRRTGSLAGPRRPRPPARPLPRRASASSSPGSRTSGSPPSRRWPAAPRWSPPGPAACWTSWPTRASAFSTLPTEPAGLSGALDKIQKTRFNKLKLRDRAESFSSARFRERFAATLASMSFAPEGRV